MRRLAMCFSSIEDSEMRENIIHLLEVFLNTEKSNNLKYIIDFSHYIGKINSIALKDKVMEVVKMGVL